MRQLLWAAVALVVSVAAAPGARAAVVYGIPSFDPNDATVPSSTTVSYDPALVSVTVAPGLTGTSADNLFALQTLNANAEAGKTSPRFQNTDADASQRPGTLLADASSTAYFQFGFAGGKGQVSLDSLTFQATQATTTNGSRGFEVSASLDGGAYSVINSTVLSTVRGSFTDINIPLTGSQYENISSADFRIRTTTGGVEYTNFAVNGSVAVPEPSSLALAGLVVGALGKRRRRK